MLPNFWAARGTECCPFFAAFHPGRSPVSNRAIPGMPSEHRTDVEMLHAEVRVERVAEPHAPAERQPLARGVGDGVAEARAAQELGGREGLPVVQHNALPASRTVTKHPLHRPPRA